MNRQQRQATRKILKLDQTPEAALRDDACHLCAFVKVQIVGSREQLYKDPQGRLVELSISHRIDPPYGLRWPYDLQARPPCRACGGTGRIEVINLQKHQKTVSMCKDCYGLGKQLKGDEFAPLCELCARFVHAWLLARANAHTEKYMTAGGRLTVATPAMLTQMLVGQQAKQWTGVGQIALPGIQK